MEIDHEIIPTVIFLPSAESFKKAVVSYKRMYVHEVMINRLSQVRNVVWEIDPPVMTIAVDWDVKQQNKHTNKQKHLRTNSSEYTPANKKD